MGENYSKPESGAQKPPGNVPSSSSHSQKPRETHISGVDHLSNATLEALSRFQTTSPTQPVALHGPRPSVHTDHPFAPPNMVRSVRSQESNVSTNNVQGPLTNELLAAAQLGGTLTSAQLNALVAIYHQQQQQFQQHLQRTSVAPQHLPTLLFPQTLSSTAPGAKSSPSPTSSSGSVGGGSLTGGTHCNRPVRAHLMHNPSPSSNPSLNMHTQKRPASGQPLYQPGQPLGSQANSIASRPPSQNAQPHHIQQSHQQRNSVSGQPGLSHLHHSAHHAPHHCGPVGHLDSSATTGLLSVHGNVPPVSHSQSSHHGTPVPILASSSPGPVFSGYQGRRPQVVPPNSHANKRPRLTNAAQPSQQQQQSHQLQQHTLSGPPTVSAVTLSGSMEALMSSVVANKAMASLTSGSGFLNPATYGSVSEAAVVAAALSPLFTNVSNAHLSGVSPATPISAVSNLNTFPVHFSSHQRPPSTTNVISSATGVHTIQQQQQQQQQQKQQQESHLLQSPVATYANPLLMGSMLNPVGGHRAGYSHVPTSTPSAHSTPAVGAQQTAGHSGSAHLSSKSAHATSVPPMASRLPSGHLNHPHHHLGSHMAPHSFHSPPPTVSQTGAAHHFMGHASLPQGSGVLRQQTKEPAYHPQVEAISPAPEESRLVDAQDAKIIREREELRRQLAVVSRDLNKEMDHQNLLEKREAMLTTRLAFTGSITQKLDSKSGSALPDTSVSPRQELPSTVDLSGDVRRTYENPVQTFISENRQRTRQHHLIFRRFCGSHVKASPFALPLYRQPADLPHLCAIQAEFRRNFRPKLVRYLWRRRKAEQARIKYLAQQYAHHSMIFTKKMEKLLNSTKQRHRDLRHRDIFEKALPEVKKNREDREMVQNEAIKTENVDDVDSTGHSVNGTVVDGTQTPVYDPVEEMNKMKEYAIDPPIPLAPWQRRYPFICQSGLVTDCRAQLQEEHDLSKWTDEEKQIFRERFLATPKNFPSIASYLEGKTTRECIHYYYLSKKEEGYKQLLKKHTARRRRGPQSDRGGGGTGSGGGGGTGGHTGSGSLHMPSSSAASFLSTSSGSPATHTSTADTHNGSAPSNTTKDSEHKSTTHKRDSTSGSHAYGTGRARSSRGRHATGRHHPNAPSDEGALSHGTKAGQDANSSTKSGEVDLSGRTDFYPAVTDSELKVAQTVSNISADVLHSSSDVLHSKMAPEKCVLSEDRPILSSVSVSTSSSSMNRICDEATIGSPAIGSIAGPGSSAFSTLTSNLVDASGSTCIKDLIHFAIEKNLTQPWNRDTHSITSEPQPGYGASSPGRSSNPPPFFSEKNY
ncbi:Nuclear receptor corepressor 1 [Paragonimus westermani]|uniref:Nuclear receptor corepressor 1 n=1 Tax=Paragonimus westermani TaxID=34504 RepID=A0A8T0D4W9_9TREM|nr:Nuclear receptor corepressor 1 [Paragonimus westermani]